MVDSNKDGTKGTSNGSRGGYDGSSGGGWGGYGSREGMMGALAAAHGGGWSTATGSYDRSGRQTATRDLSDSEARERLDRMAALADASYQFDRGLRRQKEEFSRNASFKDIQNAATAAGMSVAQAVQNTPNMGIQAMSNIRQAQRAEEAPSMRDVQVANLAGTLSSKEAANIATNAVDKGWMTGLRDVFDDRNTRGLSPQALEKAASTTDLTGLVSDLGAGNYSTDEQGNIQADEVGQALNTAGGFLGSMLGLAGSAAGAGLFGSGSLGQIATGLAGMFGQAGVTPGVSLTGAAKAASTGSLTDLVSTLGGWPGEMITKSQQLSARNKELGLNTTPTTRVAYSGTSGGGRNYGRGTLPYSYYNWS